MEELVVLREELLQRIDLVTDEQLNQKPEKNKWSIAQVVEHLYLTERGMSIAIKKALETDDHPTTLKSLEKVKNRTFFTVAPPFVSPNEVLFNKDELKRLLRKSRKSLFDNLIGIDEITLGNKSITHPVLGQLNLKQAIEFILVHEMRHLEQIQEILTILQRTN